MRVPSKSLHLPAGFIRGARGIAASIGIPASIGSVRLPLLASILFSLTIAACSSPIDSPTTQVRRGALDIVLVESGEISALRSQDVNAPMEWRSDLQIIELVDEGTQVEEGDFLVQFDTAFLEDELAEIEAALRTEYSAREGALAKQGSEKLRLDNALITAGLSREQAELSIEKLRYESESKRQEAQLDMSKALVALAEAKAKLFAQVTLDSLELALIDLKIVDLESERTAVLNQSANLTLRAPLSGLVIHAEYEWNNRRVKARVGENANPGAPVILIPDLSVLQVEFVVNEVDRSLIEEGMEVSARLEAFPDVVLDGSIRDIARLARSGNDESTVKGFEVRATLVDSDALVRPGMSVMVTVQLERIEDTILVPVAALFEIAGEAVVYPTRSWPEPVAVKLIQLGDLSAAVAGDLNEGEALHLRAPAGSSQVQELGYANHMIEERQ